MGGMLFYAKKKGINIKNEIFNDEIDFKDNLINYLVKRICNG